MDRPRRHRDQRPRRGAAPHRRVPRSPRGTDGAGLVGDAGIGKSTLWRRRRRRRPGARIHGVSIHARQRPRRASRTWWSATCSATSPARAAGAAAASPPRARAGTPDRGRAGGSDRLGRSASRSTRPSSSSPARARSWWPSTTSSGSTAVDEAVGFALQAITRRVRLSAGDAPLRRHRRRGWRTRWIRRRSSAQRRPLGGETRIAAPAAPDDPPRARPLRRVDEVSGGIRSTRSRWPGASSHPVEGRSDAAAPPGIDRAGPLRRFVDRPPT